MTNAKQTMEQMYLERDQTGDVTFMVESKQIRAHRIVLATQSPKYKAQFYGPNPDEGEIRVPGVSAAAFNVFLQFFYKETADLTMDNIEMVLDLVKQSLNDEFVECCVNFLKKSITTNNLCVVYRLAILYDIESLRLECEQQISTKTMDVFASDEFRQCDRDMLMNILKMEALNCKETDVFAACIEWARAFCKWNNLDDKKPENLRTALGDAIYQVRFSSINTEEFAELHKSLEGFFKSDESIEILYILGKLKDFVPRKFNPNPRTAQKGILTDPPAWSLECNRLLSTNKQIAESISINEVSGVGGFRCSAPIRLHGVCLGFHLKNSSFPESISVLVVKRYGRHVPIRLKCKVYQCSTRNNETFIVFEEPIEDIVYFEWDFLLDPFRLDYELVLKTEDVVDNTLSFKFYDNWLTRIFYDKI